MGMIMNRYAMLNELKNDLREGREHSYWAKNICLTGVIVHDAADDALKELLKRRFMIWAEMTGEHFLFITFVTPTSAWKRGPYGRKNYCFDNKALMMDPNQTDEDETIATALLRDYYGLPRRGSYMMLTDNLTSNLVTRLQVSADSIEEQLLMLTLYCEEEASGVTHSPGDFSSLMGRLNGMEELLPRQESFIDRLCNLTAWTTSLGGHFQGKEQRAAAEQEIERLRHELMHYDAEDYEERLFNFYEGVACWLMRSQNKRRLPPPLPSFEYAAGNEENLLHKTSQPEGAMPEMVPIKEEGILENRRLLPNDFYMDDYSQKLYRTYNVLLRSFANHEDDLDYSGLTIYLGKIVENETYLSLGQMLRYVMDIDMPEFFNKYCKKRGKVEVQAGRLKVDLNKPIEKRGAALQSVPIGQLLCLYDYMVESQGNYPDLIEERFYYIDDELHDFLSEFARKCRNCASHVDTESEATYLRTKSRFDEFMTQHLMAMVDVRRYLLAPDWWRSENEGSFDEF